MSICCHRTAFSVLTGLFAVLGWPIECQGKGKGSMDGWMMGLKGGGVTVPQRERARASGGSWRSKRTFWTTKLTCSSFRVASTKREFNKPCDNIQYSSVTSTKAFLTGLLSGLKSNLSCFN